MENEFASKELPQMDRRPSFLTAVCVIIFIFAGMSLISNLIDAAFPPDPEEFEIMMEETMDRMEGLFDDLPEETLETLSSVMLRLAEETRPIALLKAVSAILALLGAYKMWHLKRVGFHFYLIGGIIWSFSPMLFVGANALTWGYAVIYGTVVLIFATMFAMNRKYMTN